MDAHINEDELKLLTYLHEHVNGYGPRHRLATNKIIDGLKIDVDLLCRCGSYLEEHGLVGMDTYDTSETENEDEGAFEVNAICLTGLGEDYMRELESQPGIAKKLTVKAVSELWGAGKGVIVTAAGRILAEIVMGRHS